MENKNIQIGMFPITDKVNKAIKRLQSVASDEPFYLSTSKGKDSLVLEYIAEMAQVKYEKHITLTSVDPPQLINFAKQDKELIWDIPRYNDGVRKTMWNLIPRKKMPPTRLVRFCCIELKECFGIGRKVVTGVRKSESHARSNNQGEITIFNGKKAKKTFEENSFVDYQVTKRGGVIMNLDNHENRRMVELCYRTNKTLINPIIDFSDNDVWEIIHGEKIPYCGLYDCGFKRLGCIGCPMGNNKKELELYPAYKKLYIRTFDKMLEGSREAYSWQNGQDVYDWWIGDKATFRNGENMKEYLFRGKRKDNGEWVFGYYYTLHTSDGIVVPYIKVPNVETFEVFLETVGQYTGLKDKHDEQIFEGDKVETDYGMIGKVKWNKEYLCFDFCPTTGNSELLSVIGEIEIIHDNAELLEVKKCHY